MKKKSLSVNGHKTSIALEIEFWDFLYFSASKRQISLSKLISEIDFKNNVSKNLTSHLRVYCLKESLKLSKRGQNRKTFN